MTAWNSLGDTFSSSPFLAVLDPGVRVEKSEAFFSSLFARLERVRSVMQSHESSAIEMSSDQLRRLSAERAMLESALEWFKSSPE